jgi:hypothetical protein
VEEETTDEEQRPAREPPDHSIVKVKRTIGGSKHQHPFPFSGSQSIPTSHKLILQLPHGRMLSIFSSSAQHAIHLHQPSGCETTPSTPKPVCEHYANLSGIE